MRHCFSTILGVASCAPGLQVTTPEPVAPNEVNGGFIAPGWSRSRSTTSEGSAPFAARRMKKDAEGALGGVFARLGLGRGVDTGVTFTADGAALDVKVRLAQRSTGSGAAAIALDPVVESLGMVPATAAALPVMVGDRWGRFGVVASAGPGYSRRRDPGDDDTVHDPQGPFLRASLAVRVRLSTHFALQPEYQRRDWLRGGTYTQGAGVGFVWGALP
ncbi:MAG: hypothetical protein IT374_11995 [Polyangiaceae bacterium]|nr:hypothetical protein [Polyangiaceae bacterium]